MKKLFVVFAVFMLFVPLFAAEENADTQACEYARKANDVKVWEAYLRKFPKGTCAFIAETELEKNGIPIPGSKNLPVSDVIPCARGCTDPATGYIWSAVAPQDMTWDNAIKYCENLTEDGYSDWKLPTRNILETIIGKKYEKGISGKSKFGDTDYFWSSTLTGDNSAVWTLNFSYGRDDIQEYYPKSSKKSVRCVRW